MNSTPGHTSWPHAPEHRLCESGTYFVTCGTYNKLHHFRGEKRLGVLHRGLLALAAQYQWRLEAWAVFSNHYHFVAHSPKDEVDAKSLSVMLSHLHMKTAQWVNKLDKTPGRKVWHNYRETQLTIRESYLARLNYTHKNPVKHGLVGNAAMYPWCSASWFERTATLAQIKRISGMKTDCVNVYDDYAPDGDW